MTRFQLLLVIPDSADAGRTLKSCAFVNRTLDISRAVTASYLSKDFYCGRKKNGELTPGLVRNERRWLAGELSSITRQPLRLSSSCCCQALILLSYSQQPQRYPFVYLSLMTSYCPFWVSHFFCDSHTLTCWQLFFFFFPVYLCIVSSFKKTKIIKISEGKG